MTRLRPSSCFTSAAGLAAYADYLAEGGDDYAASLVRALFAAKCAAPGVGLVVTSGALLRAYAKRQEGRLYGSDRACRAANAAGEFMTDKVVIWRATAADRKAWASLGVQAGQDETPEFAARNVNSYWPSPKDGRGPLTPTGEVKLYQATGLVGVRLSNGEGVAARLLAWALLRWPGMKIYEPVWKGQPLCVAVEGEVVAGVMSVV